MNMETGLRGVVVGYCPTSEVDPITGLFYAGIPVADVVGFEPEQVMYLLYKGRQGSESELLAFREDLRKRAVCSKKIIKDIRLLPREEDPMSLLASALLIAGQEKKEDYREDCLNLIAKICEVVATVINHHAGWGETPPSKPELGYIENFVQMLRVPTGDREELVRVFKLFNILHYDHDGGNLSTFTGKAVASGGADMYKSMAAAMCALAGPRHGRANQDCLEFVQQIQKKGGDLEQLIRDRLAKKELIYGFGHAVLRKEDSRAKIFYDVAKKHYADNTLVKVALALREVGTKVLSEDPKISNPYPNVDAISGVVLSAAGFPYPEYFTVIFGLARVVGISIQIVYERCEARDGKGTPIVRPTYIYKPRETK